MRTTSAALNGATVVAALIALASVFSWSDAAEPDQQQRVARLEVRVMKLEQALVEMRGNIKEYRFSTAAGAFVCGRCKIEEDDHVK